ncbi:MAG TPA: hypothetical protein DE147_14360 [Gammaproteobacteria bacterium]|mgnify:CR=1 FL=1|nr:hypothetical protein [Gammaproteobacteria bacterium]
MVAKHVSERPVFSSRAVLMNFLVLVLCSQFAFSVLAMKGALLPQMLELWNISKTQFGILMSIYGVVHNILYVALAWVQDRFSSRVLIPLNMVMGGLTTFFLGQTTDFATLCFLFVMLSLWCEGAFWPAVLSAVRKTTDDTNQGKIFGLLEGGRGGVELLQNGVTVGLYVFMGYSILGLQLAFMLNAVVMVVLGVVAWFMLPAETLLKTANNPSLANQEVLAGMRLILRVPEVWLAGAAGFCVYFVYTAMPYFVTYLGEMYALPALAISLFGIASTSGGRIAVALPSGYLAERFLGGAVGGLGAGFVLTSTLAILMVLLTLGGASSWVVMICLMAFAFAIFFMRALYFAPYGEMGLPQRFSGSAIALASFIVYLPSSFAYLLWALILDGNPGGVGYALMFLALSIVSIVGLLFARTLRQRMRSGTSSRVADRVAELDAGLGLGGAEKKLSDQINQGRY